MKKIILLWMTSLCVLEVLSTEKMAKRKPIVRTDVIMFELKNTRYVSCNINNLEKYTVNWRRGEDVIPQVANPGEAVSSDIRVLAYRSQAGADSNYDLLIRNISWEDAGDWSCLIESERPRKFVVTIEIGDPKLLTTGQNFTVVAGDTVILPCETKDLEDHWYVSWTRGFDDDFPSVVTERGEVLITDSNVNLVDGNNIEIRNVSHKYSGEWLCNVYPRGPYVLHNLNVVDKDSKIA